MRSVGVLAGIPIQMVVLISPLVPAVLVLLFRRTSLLMLTIASPSTVNDETPLQREMIVRTPRWIALYLDPCRLVCCSRVVNLARQDSQSLVRLENVAGARTRNV